MYKKFIKDIARRTVEFLELVTVSLLILFLASIFMPPSWMQNVIASFTLQIFITSLLLLALSPLIKSKPLILLALVLLFLSGFRVYPTFIGKSASKGEEAITGDLKLLLVNINNHNLDAAGLSELIAKEDPDVVAILEVVEAQQKELNKFRDRYPFRVERPHISNLGYAFYSRLEVTDSGERGLGPGGRPIFWADIKVGAARRRVALTHLTPQITPEMWKTNQKELTALLEFLSSADKPALLLGDLNTTPWSNNYRRILNDTEFKDSRQGRGVFTTWPVGYTPFMIPLDYVIYDPELIDISELATARVGESDHLAISSIVQIRQER